MERIATNGGGRLLAGLGLGAAIMYVFDPGSGRRRRAQMRDRLTHLRAKSDAAIQATARDATNRVQGLIATAGDFLLREETPDEVIVDRIRAKLGEYVSHPGSITVSVSGGRVTVEGPVLASEEKRLLGVIRRVRGVRAVDNRLEVHQEAGSVPGLQGGLERTGQRFELLQSNWSPTARLLVGAAGTGLAFTGLRRGGALAALLGATGLGLLGRAVVNKEFGRLA